MSLSDSDIDAAAGLTFSEKADRELLLAFCAYLAAEYGDPQALDWAVKAAPDVEVEAFMAQRKQRLRGGGK